MAIEIPRFFARIYYPEGYKILKNFYLRVRVMKYLRLITVCIVLFPATNLLAVVDLYDQSPVEDAYVDDVRPDTTYNTTALQIQGFGGDPILLSNVDSVQRSFLKFDVSSLEGKTLLSAKFGIYLNDSSGYSPPSLQLYHVGDGWDESSITWNNSASLVADASAIGSDEQVDSVRYYEWNVFPNWDSADITDGYVSYMLTVGQQDLNNYAYFNSSENSEFKPYLRIEYIPEPASVALLGLGAVLFRKRR